MIVQARRVGSDLITCEAGVGVLCLDSQMVKNILLRE